MNEKERQLMFRVMNGVHSESMLMTLHQLDSFVRREKIMRWLVANKFTGDQFLELVQIQFKFSIFQMGKWVLSHIDKKENTTGLSRKELIL